MRTVTDAILTFKDSEHWKALAPSTRRSYSSIIAQYMNQPIDRIDVNRFEPHMLRGYVSERYSNNLARDKFVSFFRVVMEEEFLTGRRKDPFIMTWKKGHKSIQHSPWTEEAALRYIEARCHTQDTRFYPEWDGVAVALMFYTGQRIGDCLALEWPFVFFGANRIEFTQSKTGTTVSVPMAQELRDILGRVSSSGALRFVVGNGYGRFPYATVLGRIKTYCHRLGIDYKPVHGLRKTTAIKLAEAGCSAHEIMAITGHASLKEVERYTKGVAQAKLADRAMKKLELAKAGEVRKPVQHWSRKGVFHHHNKDGSKHTIADSMMEPLSAEAYDIEDEVIFGWKK